MVWDSLSYTCLFLRGQKRGGKRSVVGITNSLQNIDWVLKYASAVTQKQLFADVLQHRCS